MIIGRQSGLGRGLGALIPPKPGTATVSASAPIETAESTNAEQPRTSSWQIVEIPVEFIDPNPHQPREHFDHAGLEELVSSVKEHGVMQPIVVSLKPEGRYELIAGERRLRASKIAGLASIPAIVRSVTDQQKLELSIIENIQRQDLNPLEEARAYLQLQSEFNLTQDEIAQSVGKSRPQIANIIRLLQLPQEIQDALKLGRISASNARTLLSLSSVEERKELFQNMLEGNFTVRQTLARIPQRRPRRLPVFDPNLEHAEAELRDALGAKVVIKRDPRGEGEIHITFLNDEDFQTIKRRIVRND